MLNAYSLIHFGNQNVIKYSFHYAYFHEHSMTYKKVFQKNISLVVAEFTKPYFYNLKIE